MAQDLLDRKSPGAYNQAIMDFGAVQCTPKSPACGHCALAEECIARKTNMINQLPVKSKRIKKKERFFQYFLFNNGNSVLLRKRNRKDIWRGLYEFPLIESDKLITNERQLNEHDSDKQLFNGLNYSIQTISKPFRQTLTHQKIVATFWELKLNQDTFPEIEDAFWVKRGAISNFAFPKIIDLYLQDKALYLKLL